MLLGFSIVLVMASVIAWRGLVRGQVPLSLTRVVEGPAARVLGGVCLLVAIGMVAGLVWVLVES